MVNGKNRLQQAQGDVEEVTVIMMDNLNKADERNDKLTELEDRSDELLEKTKAFEKISAQLKEKKRKEYQKEEPKENKNKKMKVRLIGIGVVAAIIVLGLIIYAIVNSTRAQ